MSWSRTIWASGSRRRKCCARISLPVSYTHLVRDFAERLPGGGALTPAQAQVVGGRLNVVLRAATSRQPGYRLMGAMLAARLNIATDVCDWAAVAPEFYDSARLLDVLHDLPVRELSPVLEFLWKQDAGAMKVALLDNLPRLHFTPLQKTMDFLLAQGLGDECRQVFAAALSLIHIFHTGLAPS